MDNGEWRMENLSHYSYVNCVSKNNTFEFALKFEFEF